MTSLTRSPAHRTLAAGFAGLGLLTLAGCAVEPAAASGSSGSTTTSGTSTSDSTTTSGYADGTYTTEAAYQAPSGLETVSVELTLVDGGITSVSTSTEANDREAAQFLSRFANAISGSVVGQDISGLEVSRIAGASLTSDGFNTALEQIRSEAQV